MTPLWKRLIEEMEIRNYAARRSACTSTTWRAWPAITTPARIASSGNRSDATWCTWLRSEDWRSAVTDAAPTRSLSAAKRLLEVSGVPRQDVALQGELDALSHCFAASEAKDTVAAFQARRRSRTE